MSIQLLLPQAAHSVLVVAKQSIAKHLLYMYSSITPFLAKMLMYNLLEKIQSTCIHVFLKVGYELNALK